jgi:tetratricopeptide (TPR) repeat protein
VLILATLVSSWQAVKAKRSERKAREQAERADKQTQLALEQAEVARSAKDFVIGQVLSADPFIEPDPNKRSLLERIVQQLEGKFADQPLIEAEIRCAIGNALKDLGEVAKSATQFEKSLEIRRRVLTLQHSDTLEALAGLAEAYIDSGRKIEAEKLFAEAIPIVQASPDKMSRGAGWVLRQQGYLLFRDGHAAEAVPHLRQAVAILKQTIAPKDPKRISGIGIGLLALAMHSAGQGEAAETMLAEELRQYETDYGAETPLAALFRGTQAYFFLERGRAGDALQLLQRTVATLRQSAGTNHHNTLEYEFLLARAYEETRDVEEATKLYDSLPQRWAKYFPSDLARSRCRSIAQFFVRRGQLDKVEEVYRSLKKSFERNPPQWSWESNILVEADAVLKDPGQPQNARRSKSVRSHDSDE